MCILDYIALRFDPHCAAASINKYQAINQTIDLTDEIMFTVRSAFGQADCGQVIVITTRSLEQLIGLNVLDEYINRGAKFLCLSTSEQDKRAVVWLNEQLVKANSLSRIYVEVSTVPAPNVLYRGTGALQLTKKATFAAVLVNATKPAVAQSREPKSTKAVPWYGKHAKRR